jgi:hypothetical protein
MEVQLFRALFTSFEHGRAAFPQFIAFVATFAHMRKMERSVVGLGFL